MVNEYFMNSKCITILHEKMTSYESLHINKKKKNLYKDILHSIKKKDSFQSHSANCMGIVNQKLSDNIPHKHVCMYQSQNNISLNYRKRYRVHENDLSCLIKNVQGDYF